MWKLLAVELLRHFTIWLRGHCQIDLLAQFRRFGTDTFVVVVCLRHCVLFVYLSGYRQALIVF